MGRHACGNRQIPPVPPGTPSATPSLPSGIPHPVVGHASVSVWAELPANSSYSCTYPPLDAVPLDAVVTRVTNCVQTCICAYCVALRSPVHKLEERTWLKILCTYTLDVCAAASRCVALHTNRVRVDLALEYYAGINYVRTAASRCVAFCTNRKGVKKA